MRIIRHPALSGFLFLLLFAACDLYGKIGGDDTNIEGALPELLKGEWVFPATGIPSERYVIGTETIEYGYGGGESVFDFKGIIRFVSNYSTDSGVIIIEYTEAPSYALYNGNSFFGIYYRNLKNDTVQIANSTNLADGYSAPDTATLDEAIAKFTRLFMGNYIDWGYVNPQRRVR